MAIYRLFQQSAFDEYAIKAMAAAYESALAELALDRTDSLTEVIACKIVECAQTGNRIRSVSVNTRSKNSRIRPRR
jgi:hypothetical protein